MARSKLGLVLTCSLWPACPRLFKRLRRPPRRRLILRVLRHPSKQPLQHLAGVLHKLVGGRVGNECLNDDLDAVAGEDELTAALVALDQGCEHRCSTRSTEHRHAQ
jgi:hypothetical protein